MSGGHSCCGGGDHEPGCSLNPANDRSAEFSLYTKINWTEFCTLNEAVKGTGQKVFKSWEDRLSEEYVESDVDGDLIFNIPFTGEVKLMGIIIVGGPGEIHPTKVRLFKGNYRGFDEVQGEADQEIELHPDSKGVKEYSIKTTRFNSVSYLCLHFPGNYGDVDNTRISYIGLRGDFKKINRDAIAITNYELRPSLADHKNALDEGMRHVL
ncbi:PITH domain-containing protein GA19395 [Hyalella azteca]|uniref:PITH domain-containing protein GA19395 n=1 Tax=Hyalella azteca TaxID=294128 RepID=A0A8B7N7Q7_HYAAZ|nr:PITH domain-containing protein GA19395 [Hyalella azteca]